MWHTSEGDRTLEGAEAALIREAIGWVADMLELEASDPTDVWIFGVPAFDHLEVRQKLALLCQVAEALLRPDIAPPNLTACHEATVGILYRGIEQCLEMEIDDDADGVDVKHWRGLMLAALADIKQAASGVGKSTSLPDQNCLDMEEWGLLIETMEGRVLWDADWMDEDLFLDAAPDTTAAIKQELNIADDYYTALAPDPPDRELTTIRGRLRELTRD